MAVRFPGSCCGWDFGIFLKNYLDSGFQNGGSNIASAPLRYTHFFVNRRDGVPEMQTGGKISPDVRILSVV